MARVVIDPITRIEGHLKIEVEVANGKVTNAWSSSTLFRGIEIMLQGRDPRDAYLFTQRACGVCTYIHGLASIRSVDAAVGAKVPENGRLIRNLTVDTGRGNPGAIGVRFNMESECPVYPESSRREMADVLVPTRSANSR